MTRFVLSLATLCLCLLPTPVSAQVAHVLTWDPSVDESTRVLEYHVFRDSVYAGAISVPNRTFPFVIAPGTSTTFVVRSYGWLMNADGTLPGETGVGDPSVPFVWNEPVIVPPETCAPDGTGNGIDEDGDGLVDEGCLVPPPPPADTVAPTVTATVRQHGGSHNFTVTITAADNVAIVQIALMQGSGVRAACSPNPPTTNATCVVELALKQRGTYTYEANAWDSSNNMSAAPVTIRR